MLDGRTINAISKHAALFGFSVNVELDAKEAYTNDDYAGLVAVELYETSIDDPAEPVGFFTTDGDSYVWRNVYAGEQNKVVTGLTGVKNYIKALSKELSH